MMSDDPRKKPSRFRDRFLQAWRPVARRLQVPDDGGGLFLSVVFATILAVGIWAAFYFNPQSVSWIPKCPVHALTGLDCPGCGTARALHAASHGHLREAFRYNPILAVAVPFLVVIVIKPRWAKKPSVSWSVFAVAVLWMLVRNLVHW